ncbi:hypothetical protein E3V39_01850 [Gammaproteobacteria bacterium LSUCC0112]|nr:hypothetical protein E3V39_01850 [Gammaproteobacteria bacterium LSUCC0112]
MSKYFSFPRATMALFSFFVTALLASGAALASDGWRISEIFTSGDGTAQYIKLSTTSDNQQNLAGQTLRAFDTNGQPGLTFTFPSNLSSSQTANTSVLIGTDAFSALSQLPVDYRLPSGFLSASGGSVRLGTIDTLTYQREQLPRNGYQALSSARAAVTANPVNFSGNSALLSVDIISVFNDATGIVNLPVVDVPGSGIANASLQLTRVNPFEFTLVDAYFYAPGIATGTRPTRFGQDGKLYLPQVIVGAEVYELYMTLLDDKAMRFGNLEVVNVRPRPAMPALPPAASAQASPESVVPFSTFNSLDRGIPFPINSGTKQISENRGGGVKRHFSLDYAQASLAEFRRDVSSTQSALEFVISIEPDASQISTVSPSFCAVTISGRINEAALDGRVIPLPLPYTQAGEPYINIQQSQYCSIPDGTGKLSWLMLGMDFNGQLQLRLEPTSETTGRLRLNVLMNGEALVESGEWPSKSTSNSPFQFDGALNVEYRKDGSIVANGTQVRKPTVTTPPPSVPGSGGSTGGSGSGGSSGSSACVNTINVSPTNFASYWSQIKPGNATGTGRRAAGNTVFSDLRSTDVALILDATSGSNRYQVQMMLTPANLVANKTLPFLNAGVGAGLTSTGAVGRLIAVNGGVNDDWRTNRDFGKNKNMGEIRISAVTPEIRGTYSFRASGDGYPTLNNQYAEVSGTFCIKP